MGKQRVLTMLAVGVVLGLLGATIAASPSDAATASLGTARGADRVELSLDDGRTWLALGGRSLPILDGTQVRSTTGGALLDLSDGSRLNVLPFTAVRVREGQRATELTLLHGRLTFLLPARTRIELATPLARLEPARDGAMAGEIFVGGDQTLGVQMSQGSLRVRELAGAQRVLVAAAEPVFLPKKPTTGGPLFAREAAAAPPAGAKAVFNQAGESLGYLAPDGRLVIHPGYTADLTRPFAPKLLQAVAAKIPEEARETAVGVFDVNGTYLGYLSGPTFQPYHRGLQAGSAGGGMGSSALGAGLAAAGTSLTAISLGGGGGSSVAGGGGSVTSGGSVTIALCPASPFTPPAGDKTCKPNTGGNLNPGHTGTPPGQKKK